VFLIPLGQLEDADSSHHSKPHPALLSVEEEPDVDVPMEQQAEGAGVARKGVLSKLDAIRSKYGNPSGDGPVKLGTRCPPPLFSQFSFSPLSSEP